jgi:hypothetical protein
MQSKQSETFYSFGINDGSDSIYKNTHDHVWQANESKLVKDQ